MYMKNEKKKPNKTHPRKRKSVVHLLKRSHKLKDHTFKGKYFDMV